MDIDGDGIPYRTVMGNRSPRSAYFTRGTGHDVYGNYNEDPKIGLTCCIVLKRN